MIVVQRQEEKSSWYRLLISTILIAAGLLVFWPVFTFSSEMSAETLFYLRTGTAVLLLALTILFRLDSQFERYWQLPLVLFIAALSLLATSFFSNRLLQLTGLPLTNAAGLAMAKVADAVPIIITILLVNKLFGFDLGSLYVQRGNMKQGLLIGLGSFTLLAGLALFQGKAQGITFAQVLPVVPWILLFVVANGFMEELLFRGLFLKRYSSALGSVPAIFVTALVFTAVHLKVNYANDLWGFLVITFFLALVWGWLMQKTDSLIGSFLFHAGADCLIITGIFAAFGAGFT